MRFVILILALSGMAAGAAAPPAETGNALERVQRLIYGSNRPPAKVAAPAAPVVRPAQPPTNWDQSPAVITPEPTPAAPKSAPTRSETKSNRNIPAATATEPSATPVVVAPITQPATKPVALPARPPVVESKPAPPPAASVTRIPAGKGSATPRFSPPPILDPAPLPPPHSEHPAKPLAAAPPTTTPAPEVATGPSDTDNLLDDKHRLSPGDKLSFQILEDRDPAKSLIVTDSGEIDAPYIGRVRAVDKTCRQLGRELKAQLEQEYYYRASVVLGLDAASKVRGKIYIWGQVRSQGAIDIPTEENFTVGKAVLRAGGFADFANKKKVKLVRTKPDGSKDSFELNMVEVLEKARMDLDVPVQDNDFIIVPSRLINF